MKMHLRRAAMALFIVASGVSSVANAALVNRGGGLIYDTDLNITWLKDANYAMTSGFHADGRMFLSTAMVWALTLSYYDHVRNVTYTDWRLPTTLQPDATCSSQSGSVSRGHNCTGSEMGHLFYTELGGTAGASILSSTDPDLDFFTVQPRNYWSRTSATDTNFAWHFSFGTGLQNTSFGDSRYFAWAVRDGDVAAAPPPPAAVPIPATAWLFGSGLLGLLGVARARRKG